MDIEVRKDIIMADNMGEIVLFPYSDIEEIPLHISCNVSLKEVPNKHLRSYRQLSMYWALCEEVAQNKGDNINFNTKEKVSEQCKIHTRYIDCYFHYIHPDTGVQNLSVKTKSISFAELNHLASCRYFDQAFDYLAWLLQVPRYELENRYGKRA